MILVLDTAGPQAFIGLWEDTRKQYISDCSFEAGRSLNSLIIAKLGEVISQSLVDTNNMEADYSVVSGVVVNAGPGSFTGLRIGISVANAIAYAQNIPIVGVEAGDAGNDFLLQNGLKMLESAGSQPRMSVVPQYGAEPNITTSKNK